MRCCRPVIVWLAIYHLTRHFKLSDWTKTAATPAQKPFSGLSRLLSTAIFFSPPASQQFFCMEEGTGQCFVPHLGSSHGSVLSLHPSPDTGGTLCAQYSLMRYADDVQLYFSSKPGQMKIVIFFLYDCLNYVANHFLWLNANKPDLLIITADYMISKVANSIACNFWSGHELRQTHQALVSLFFPPRRHYKTRVSCIPLWFRDHHMCFCFISPGLL